MEEEEEKKKNYPLVSLAACAESIFSTSLSPFAMQ